MKNATDFTRFFQCECQNQVRDCFLTPSLISERTPESKLLSIVVKTLQISTCRRGNIVGVAASHLIPVLLLFVLVKFKRAIYPKLLVW